MEPTVRAFAHIEIVHPDPDSAAAFLRDVLGAEKVEHELARYAETLADGVRCIHMRLGSVVLQLIKPAPGLDSWVEHLAQHGPSVHNVTIQVSDAEQVRAAMSERGGEEVATLAIDLRHVIPDATPRTAYVYDCREQTGLRFEFIEPRQ